MSFIFWLKLLKGSIRKWILFKRECLQLFAGIWWPHLPMRASSWCFSFGSWMRSALWRSVYTQAIRFFAPPLHYRRMARWNLVQDNSVLQESFCPECSVQRRRWVQLLTSRTFDGAGDCAGHQQGVVWHWSAGNSKGGRCSQDRLPGRTCNGQHWSSPTRCKISVSRTLIFTSLSLHCHSDGNMLRWQLPPPAREKAWKPSKSWILLLETNTHYYKEV